MLIGSCLRGARSSGRRAAASCGSCCRLVRPSGGAGVAARDLGLLRVRPARPDLRLPRALLVFGSDLADAWGPRRFLATYWARGRGAAGCDRLLALVLAPLLRIVATTDRLAADRGPDHRLGVALPDAAQILVYFVLPLRRAEPDLRDARRHPGLRAARAALAASSRTSSPSCRLMLAYRAASLAQVKSSWPTAALTPRGGQRAGSAAHLRRDEDRAGTASRRSRRRWLARRPAALAEERGPTRTRVAPSSIATSKSWLMPIDSSPAASRPGERAVAQLAQPPEVGPRGLGVVRVAAAAPSAPRRAARRGRAALQRRGAGAFSASPNFVSSPARSTWTSTGSDAPAPRPRALEPRGERQRRRPNGSRRRARPPSAPCSPAGGRPGASAARPRAGRRARRPWSRPPGRGSRRSRGAPAAKASRTASAGWVLLTATRRDVRGARRGAIRRPGDPLPDGGHALGDHFLSAASSPCAVATFWARSGQAQVLLEVRDARRRILPGRQRSCPVKYGLGRGRVGLIRPRRPRSPPRSCWRSAGRCRG